MSAAWSEQLALGHPDMDADHLRLAMLVDQVSVLGLTATPGAVAAALRDLGRHTGVHFWREETAMALTGYPGTAGHIRAHRWLLAGIDGLADGFPDAPVDAVALAGQLREWLGQHVVTTDRSLADWLAGVPLDELLLTHAAAGERAATDPADVSDPTGPTEPPGTPVTDPGQGAGTGGAPWGWTSGQAQRMLTGGGRWDTADLDAEDPRSWPVLTGWLRETLAELADAQAQAARLREQVDALALAVGEAVVVTDADLRVTWVNQHARTLLGGNAADLIGTPLLDGPRPLLPAAAGLTRHDLARADAGAALMLTDVAMTDSAGRALVVTVRAAVLRDDDGMAGAVVAVADVTRARALEAGLRQAQRLEAIGALAAGVAHEINNPVQYVGDAVTFIADTAVTLAGGMAGVQQALTRGDTDAATALVADLDAAEDIGYLTQEIPAAAGQARDGLGRVATVVTALRTFGEPDPPAPVAVDLADLVATVVTVAGHEIYPVADIRVDIAPGTEVTCLPADLRQAMLNLLVHAGDAIAERQTDRPGRGTIDITARPDHGTVTLTITHDGTGIAADTRDALFDPSYATAHPGRGAGHGLATAHHSIVTRHGGHLDLSSHDDATTVTVRLPAPPRAAHHTPGHPTTAAGDR